MSEIREGELTAKNLVRSAIADGKLSPNAINNSKYLDEVNMALQDFANSH
ncbi:MAG: hypothetical protein Tsb0014_47420 [Pleurocapsa sp.]